MARPGAKDRGIVFKDGQWWVRLYVNGREKWFRADNKTQAKTLYGRLKADIREGKYFPEKFRKPKALTLRVWITRYLEGSTNRGLKNEKFYGRRWSLMLGKRLLSEITTEDLRHVQAKLKAHTQRVRDAKRTSKRRGKQQGWSDGTINRHFAFLRHVLMLAVKDGKLDRNPMVGVKFLPEAQRTRFLTDAELKKLKKKMPKAD